MSSYLARFALAIALLALAPIAARASDDALAPDDFAWGRSVETRSGDPLQTLLLDLAVYRGSVGPELVDLRVFNGAGEVVPHALRALADPSEQQGELVPVPLFRVPEQSALAPGADAAERRTVRDVAIEVGSDGAIVRVGPQAVPDASGARLPRAYLVDLSQLERPIVGLDLALAPEPAEFAVALRVESSEDLERFDPLASRVALARLDQAGHRIERSQIELPASKRRYLLLSASQPLPVELLSVRARLAPVVDPPPRQRERVAGARTDDEDRVEYVFDLGGAIPVDRAQIDFPIANTVVEADLYSATEASGPWLHHFQGVLYELERADGELRNPEVSVPPIRRRYFKLAVADKGGGLGGGAPELEVAWMPEQLLFVARGAGPFALGYGRAQVDGARFDAAELIDSALPPGADPKRDVPRETAKLGSVRAVGDPSVLEPREEPIAPRTLALWGVLVVSVAIVLLLSVRLLRRMSSSEDPIEFR